MKKVTTLEWLYSLSIEYFVNWRKHLKEYLLVIAIMLMIRSLVGVVYRIPTPSMVPTFKIGDTLVANRFYYGLKLPFTDELSGFRLPAIKEVERGDLIIFRAPEEKVFVGGRIRLSEQTLPLIAQLNQEATNKQPISPVERGDFLFDSLGELNYVLSYYDTGNALLHLEQSLYEKYRLELERLGFDLEEKTFALMTYAQSDYDGFFFSLLKTPLSGLSIIGQALVDSPYFLSVRLVTLLVGRGEGLDGGLRIRLYPNGFLDRTKEFVKRVVAVGGDKVEIRNKRLFVNDVEQSWVGEVVGDAQDPDFVLLAESIRMSREDSTNNQHPLRISRTSLKPFFNFNANHWPYDPDGVSAVNFRDNFGPIVVKEGHYFAMGDNRDESQDSRYFGEVPHWAIKGTPMLIFYPFSRFGVPR